METLTVMLKSNEEKQRGTSLSLFYVGPINHFIKTSLVIVISLIKEPFIKKE
jgi:hypothetical protein